MSEGATTSVWERADEEPANFPRAPWGHRGYDETSVDAFADQVVRDLSIAEDQITDLRAEVDRLHRYIRRQWTAVAAAEAAGDRSAGRVTPDGDLVSPAAQARAVLNRAQEIADRRLAQADERLVEAERLAADAEQVLTEAHSDSTRLLLVARSRYEDIVVRAHQRADRAAEVALDEFEQHDGRGTANDAGRIRAELEVKAAYLRTFAKVSRAALQAALDVTAREFDRLLGASAAGELPDPAPMLQPLTGK